MITILSFYKFKKINNLNKLKKLFFKNINSLSIKGLIVLSPEGINGTLAGSLKNINSIKKIIISELNISKFDIQNITRSNFIPFLRAKIKIKSEVVPINERYDFDKRFKKKYLTPSQWNNFNPNSYNFREFKNYLSTIKKNENVGMFCTGGIRCEKASNYLYKNGYENIYMLKGGIINYFNKIKPKNSMWKGECFVFDNRVTIKKDATPGTYTVCGGCRMPISTKDTKSSKYKIGLSCPKCYETLSNDQIKRFTMRNNQIVNSKIKFKFKEKKIK